MDDVYNIFSRDNPTVFSVISLWVSVEFCTYKQKLIEYLYIFWVKNV